jgi:hypothetical protein
VAALAAAMVPKREEAVMTAQSLALYDEMCRAIDAAYKVDEAKSIRDKAIAWEVYSRQAHNVEAERRACEIRLRAERKAGQLLRGMEKAKGAAQPGSKQQSSDWQKLGAMPEDQFEGALAGEKPTTAGILRDTTTPPDPDVVPVSHEALWLWGRLRDFERDGLLAKPAAEVLATMTSTMLDDVHVLAPRVAAWLNQIGRATWQEGETGTARTPVYAALSAE